MVIRRLLRAYLWPEPCAVCPDLRAEFGRALREKAMTKASLDHWVGQAIRIRQERDRAEAFVKWQAGEVVGMTAARDLLLGDNDQLRERLADARSQAVTLERERDDLIGIGDALRSEIEDLHVARDRAEAIARGEAAARELRNRQRGKKGAVTRARRKR